MPSRTAVPPAGRPRRARARPPAAPLALPVLFAVVLLPLHATAQTLYADDLPAPPAVTDYAAFADANGGSLTWQGVTFDPNFDVVGSQYLAPFASPPDDFAATLAGHDYALVGDAFSPGGSATDGLTLSTDKVLTSLYVGYDDNGLGSNDADQVTVTAVGAGGDLASVTASLDRPLTLLDTSSFLTLSGITGYRISTEASNALYEANQQAYLVADGLSFGPAPAAVPEPSPAALFGVGGAGVLLLLARARRRPRPVPCPTTD